MITCLNKFWYIKNIKGTSGNHNSKHVLQMLQVFKLKTKFSFLTMTWKINFATLKISKGIKGKMLCKCSTSIKFKTKFSFLMITCEIDFDILNIFEGITGNHNFPFQLKFWNCLKNVK